MIGDIIGNTSYCIEQEINLSGTYYIFAVDDNNEYPYLVGNMKKDELLERYDNCVVSNDYLVALREWNIRVQKSIEQLQERNSAFKEKTVLGNGDVEPITNDTSLKNKVVVVKSDVFLREARESRKQLRFCVGGFGAEPNSRGRAVMCDSIYGDEKCRFDRNDILGIIKTDKIPDWAKNKIAQLQAEHNSPITSSSDVKPIKK